MLIKNVLNFQCGEILYVLPNKSLDVILKVHFWIVMTLLSRDVFQAHK